MKSIYTLRSLPFPSMIALLVQFGMRKIEKGNLKLNFENKTESKYLKFHG